MEKVILITGGAKGIGAGIVKACAKAGHTVIINYNTSHEKALILKEELAIKGYDIHIFKADISKSTEANLLIDFCIEKFNKIDVLVNNAGIGHVGLITELSDEDWNKIITTNLTSTFYTSRQALKYMINKKSGKIINISSMWGITGGSCEVAYSASKAGMIGFTKALAKEVGPSNIAVNAIAPGIIETDMMACFNKDEKNEIINEMPLRKMGYPEDIAKCVMWLIEDNYTTGQVVSINGGSVI